MLKGLLAFALSRRPIILLSLGAFVVGGLIAFSKLNIEAYPNPAPVILEITAQAPGQSAEEMEPQAAEQRMRPMLMTALSACIGLLPAAISTGIGSQVQRPLATVVVGGMLIGPLILLVVVPALQTIFLSRETSSTPAPEAEART